MTELRSTLVLLAALGLEAYGAEAPEITAASDFIHCAAWYTLSASSAREEGEKKRRTALAVEFSHNATILTDDKFFTVEYKRTHDRVLTELKSDPDPGKMARRAFDFCGQVNEKHHSILTARTKERNEQIRKRLR